MHSPSSKRDSRSGLTADAAPCFREADEARKLLIDEGWNNCPTWQAIQEGERPARPTDAGPGDCWQFHATRTRNLHFRSRVLLPAMPPSSRAMLRSQAGPHAGAWLSAIPGEPSTTLTPQAMLLALRRRLRLPLPLSPHRCGPNPGCGLEVDALGDHALACPRTGLLARRAKVVEGAWLRVAREAVGAEGQVVPQQWLAHTTAPGVRPDDRRRLDMVVYGATANTRSALLRRHACVAADPRRSPTAARGYRRRRGATGRGAPQADGLPRTHMRRRDLVHLRAQRAPPAVRAAAAGGWSRRWQGIISIAVQQAVAGTALGRARPAQPQAGPEPGPAWKGPWTSPGALGRAGCRCGRRSLKARTSQAAGKRCGKKKPRHPLVLDQFGF